MKDNKLEVGDELYTEAQFSNNTIYVGKVDRVTAQWAFIGKTKIHREQDSFGKGFRGTATVSAYSTKSYYILSPEKKLELQREFRKKKLIHTIVNFDFSNTSIDVLEQIEKLIVPS